MSTLRSDDEAASQAARCWAQGYRCGHIEGGVNTETMGGASETAYLLSHEAASAQTSLSHSDRLDWASGYRYGFMARVRGEALPAEVASVPPPV